MSVNKAILIGRLGKDPDLRYTPGGKAVASFSLATSEPWSGLDGQKKESSSWHQIVAWGRQAEVLKEYMHKGSQIYIEGRISNRSYDDKEGNKKYISEVVVQNFQFLDSKSSSSGTYADNEQQAPAGTPPAPPASPGSDDDDLPF